MIIKINKSACDVLGLAKYLGHDKGAAGEPRPKTSDRVLWSSTRRLVCDDEDIETGARIIASTIRDRSLPRRAAGVSARERKCKHPVGHIVLAWPKDERPSRQEMEDASDDLLRTLGYGSHEAILVAHAEQRSAPRAHPC